MRKWILKAIVQKTISFLPYGHKLNFLFQKYITKRVYLTDEYFIDRLTHARHHIEAYKNYSKYPELKSVFELGTGWYPVVPISMFLHGADLIYTDDISPLCNKMHMVTTIKKFVEYHQNNTLTNYILIKTDRFKTLEEIIEKESVLSFRDIAEQLRIKFLLKDARQLPIKNKSIELITSNNTFEHIYPAILKDILKEFKRIIKNGGIMSHAIDMTDHFAHFDKSITVFNFLKFSKKQWKIIDNSIQPQNRLRITGYRDLYKEVDIPISKEYPNLGTISELESVKINSEFREIMPSDLVIIHCTIISAF